MNENSPHDKTDPGIVPGLKDTQPLRIMPDAGTTQSQPIVAPLPEARTAQTRASRPLLWVFGLLAVAILGGSVAYYFLYPSGEAPSPLHAKAEVPAVLLPYLDKAAQGDSGAMRMLGTMYYNGLNVPADRKEGVKWYRKAAAAGSVAARKDLEQLGLAVDEK
ncbi:SEL1-like repeat protein [Mesoterricola silvestris]|uniref:Sel1 repeat-containing protein n=1 Tax=Mesoterricola silvestris TaxID=2927979 RepID=A0AA48KAY9_9BACT|nr:hypothetical protein [Mesoterricola silvestris]BDU73792.1 hypothetical protein METEAL_29660 [Mesoterricola silvestris]